MKKKAAAFLIPMAALAVIMACSACGKKGPLVLEPQPEPTIATNIEVRQSGDKIRIQWDFPKLLSDRKTEFLPEKIDRVDIHYSDKEIPGGRFPDKSSILRKLTSADISRFIDPLVTAYLQRLPENQRVKSERFTYYTEIPFDIPDLNNKVHFFSVRFHYNKKKSPVGDVVAIHTQTPVKPVADLAIVQEKKLLTLKWSKPVVDIKGMPVSHITGYKVFRKMIPRVAETGTETPHAQPNPQTLQDNGYISKGQVLKEVFSDADTSAEGLYKYYIIALAANNIESSSSNVVEINVADLFPPDVPANLVGLRSSGFMFLTWSSVRDADFSHFRLYRKTASGEHQLLADKLTVPQYKDTAVSAGNVYYYSVSAVDNHGNESEYSNEVYEQF